MTKFQPIFIVKLLKSGVRNTVYFIIIEWNVSMVEILYEGGANVSISNFTTIRQMQLIINNGVQEF